MKKEKKQNETALELVHVVKTYIGAGKHYGNGECTMKGVGKICGVANLGTVLNRPGISLATVCKVIDAVHQVVNDASFSARFSQDLKKVFYSPFDVV